MKNKTLFLSMALIAASICVNANEVTGSCASFIQANDAYSFQEDSVYLINKAAEAITVDGVAESAWAKAFPRVLSKVASENASVIINLDNYPQSEAEGHATYRALWTLNEQGDGGVYMFISIKDNMIRYQNPGYQWENDAIELFFAKDRGESKKQIIIPAMIGTPEPTHPAALDFESGSAKGSQADYAVFGYDAQNWDATLFNWAMKKTTDGWDLEVYMDKDIVTNGNSETNYGLDKMFAGDVNLDIAGENQNSAGLYIRESILAMLGNNNNGWNVSTYYGYFKMVDQPNAVELPKSSDFNAVYSSDRNEIKISSSALVSSVEVYNVAGQVIPSRYSNSTVSLPAMKQGIYVIQAKDHSGNKLGIQKIVVY